MIKKPRPEGWQPGVELRLVMVNDKNTHGRRVSCLSRGKVSTTVLGVPTWHRYVDTVECVLPMKPGNPGERPVGGPAWQHIWECEITGLQRPYGAEPRDKSSFDTDPTPSPSPAAGEAGAE